jgi:hypothetical protein
MTTSDQAVLAIRHAIQDHGDENYRLGQPAWLDNIRWFGKLLGWTWPPSYLEVLAKHDGAWIHDAIFLSFLESIDLLLLFHKEWHRRDGYWAVAHDECGNYLALSFGSQDPYAECPVVFLEYGTNEVGTVAVTYAEFVVKHLAEQCARIGCAAPIRTPER